MADFTLLLEAEKRGILPADKVPLLAEARKRGLIPWAVTEPLSAPSFEGYPGYPAAADLPQTDIKPPRGVLPTLGSLGGGGLALALTKNPTAAYMANVGGAMAGSAAEDLLYGEPSKEEIAKRALESGVLAGIAPGAGIAAERLAMPGGKGIVQEAQNALRFARERGLPIDIHEAKPSWITSLFSGDIFAAGRYKTKQYAKTANDYLVGLRSKILQDLVGAEETASIPLAAVPGKVKPALKLKTTEAYEEPIRIVKEQFGDADALVRLENMRRTAGQMLGDARIQNAKKARGAIASPKEWLEDFLASTEQRIIKIEPKTLPKSEPAIPKWHTRLYRGEHPTRQRSDIWDDYGELSDKGSGGWFTQDKNYAEYFKETQGQGAHIVYVDLPDDIAKTYLTTAPGYGNVDTIVGKFNEPSYFIPSLRKKAGELKPVIGEFKSHGVARFSDVHQLQSQINRVFYSAGHDTGAPLLASLADDLVRWDAATGQQLNEAYGVARAAAKNTFLFDTVYSVLRKSTSVDKASGAEMLNGQMLKAALQTPNKRGITATKDILDKLGPEKGKAVLDDLMSIADYATHTRGLRAKEAMPLLDPTTLISGGAGPAAGSLLNVAGPAVGIAVPQGTSLALTVALTGPGKSGFLRNWLLKEGHPALKMGTRFGVQMGGEQLK